MSERAFPPALAALHELDFNFDEGIDFRPFPEFLSSADTTRWFQAWTANGEVSGDEFRVFGDDGTGGYAAFRLGSQSDDILSQPIVFMGSEGQTGVVARDFSAYLWLLANNIGPMEAVTAGVAEQRPNAAFMRFAEQHAPEARRSPAEILEDANLALPDFLAYIDSLCR
ncbi:MAG: SMI1/KNR4 family protein [Myxococcota bacterium]